jgi:hypothetical protein
MLLKQTFNLFLLLCGNNALKRKTAHISMAHTYTSIKRNKIEVYVLTFHSLIIKQR